jgi:DNA repair protein RadC
MPMQDVEELLAEVLPHLNSQVVNRKSAVKDCVPMYDVPVWKIKVLKDSIQTVPEKKVNHPDVAVKAFRAVMGELDREHLVVLCLSKQNEFLGINVVAVGTVHEVPADRGHIANLVTSVRGTAGWIAIHNHLSSNPAPSPEDRAVFKTMVKLGDSIDRPLIDAIIVATGTNAYYSHKTASPYDFVVRE